MLILLKSNGITWDFIKCFLLMLSFQGKTGDFYSDKVFSTVKNVFSPSGVISAVDNSEEFNFLLSLLYTV